jgi:hypothetical protein
MEERVPHRGFRLAFQQKNIHTAAMILQLLMGTCLVNVERVDRIISSIFRRFNLEWKTRILSLLTSAA